MRGRSVQDPPLSALVRGVGTDFRRTLPIVPVEFLSDDQVAAYGRFAGPPGQGELERFFFLDDAARALTARRRGDHNRLGFAVQLGTVRFLGTFLPDPLDVPAVVTDYLAGQLEGRRRDAAIR